MSQRPYTFSFGEMADSYDAWYKTRLGFTYDALEKEAVARMLPDPIGGDRLLDIGCGTGHWSAFFSERGFVVTGVDISPEMIEVARGKRVANASFAVADAHALPFEDGRFDVTAAMTTLEFVRDAEEVVGEMGRCTRRPGGVLVIGVLNAAASINRRRKRAGKEPYASARLSTPSELKSLLAQYGKACVKSVAFVPRWSSLVWLSPLLDTLGRRLRPGHGAFIAGRVRL